MFVIILSKNIFKNIRGMAIFPFIFIQNKKLKENKILINHESIHLKQQLEMLWFLFFAWYLIEFLIRWMQYKNSNQAYLNICFEREAYANEKKMNYLKERKIWQFLRYL